MAIVVGIMGVLVAITIPAFSKYSASHRLEGATNELVADIHYTRSLSVAQRRTHQIEFVDTQTYRIVETTSGNVIRTRTLHQSLSCGASADPNFYAWGLADPVDINLTGASRTKGLTLLANGNITHN
jgi:Tfp pilus assembly protein FimT